MDAIVVVGVGIGVLLAFGWLAAHAGVDSRHWPVSEEERLAGFGYTWGEPGRAVAGGLGDHAWMRLGDLRLEADAERLIQATRLVASTPPAARPGRSAGRRSPRARLALVLATLAARVDRAAAVEGLF